MEKKENQKLKKKKKNIIRDKTKRNIKLKKNKSYDDFKKSKFCLNYGDYIGHKLYEKGINYKLNIQKILKQKYNYDNKLPSDDISFTPKISKKSKELTSNRNKNIKIEDRLLALGKEQKKKLLKKVAEKNFIENEQNKSNDYNFHTKITKNKIMLTRNKSVDIFTKLYKGADIKKNKIQKTQDNYYKHNYSFKPEITKMAREMKDSKYNQIIKRFYEKKQKKENDILMEHVPGKDQGIKNKDKNKDKAKKSVIINKNNNNKKNSLIINKNINGDDNMNMSADSYDKKIIQNQRKDWAKYNDNILKTIKEIKIKEIFDLLDKDKKKYISYTNISYNNIPNKIMIGLTPVIKEVNRNKNKRINYEEFRLLINESLTSCMSEE